MNSAYVATIRAPGYNFRACLEVRVWMALLCRWSEVHIELRLEHTKFGFEVLIAPPDGAEHV